MTADTDSTPTVDTDHDTDEQLEQSVDEIPLAAGREKWDGDVVKAETQTFDWGTHTFEVYYQIFADDGYHLSVTVPRDPPPSAAYIVADALAGNAKARAVGKLLARAWALNWRELDVRHEEHT